MLWHFDVLSQLAHQCEPLHCRPLFAAPSSPLDEGVLPTHGLEAREQMIMLFGWPVSLLLHVLYVHHVHIFDSLRV